MLLVVRIRVRKLLEYVNLFEASLLPDNDLSALRPR